eukprot:1159303-Pelagomonas_calceolata.AAC.5
MRVSKCQANKCGRKSCLSNSWPTAPTCSSSSSSSKQGVHTQMGLCIWRANSKASEELHARKGVSHYRAPKALGGPQHFGDKDAHLKRPCSMGKHCQGPNLAVCTWFRWA